MTPTLVRRFSFPVHLSHLIAFACIAIVVAACSPLRKIIANGGTKKVAPVVPPHTAGPYVLIFALDGVGHDQFADAILPPSSPRVEQLFGKPISFDGVFEHAYSIPNAVSVLPSTTIDAWAATFTGTPPAYNGVMGNEWFERETATFYAPAPVSLNKPGQSMQVYTDDLVGERLKTRTLFQQVKGPSFVSLNAIYKGSSVFTSVDTSGFGALASSYVESEIGDFTEAEQRAYTKLDMDSVPQVLGELQKRGVPAVQVAYFPGIDLYTHIAKSSLHDQEEYFKTILDPSIGLILDEYQKQGALDQTFVIFIADHGHTPVLKDNRHALGADPDSCAPKVLESIGFKMRPPTLHPWDDDYQAVLAYQGAIAYVYLANRAICTVGQKCDWSKPPRFKEDVMVTARAFYQANKTGAHSDGLKGSLDLIFARKPVPTGVNTHPYEVFDGHRLISIQTYLKAHPRPDFMQLERRMRWLSAGPWGNHAGDVLLLSKSGLNRPIEDRYYFSKPYNSWHGSPSIQDSHITFAVANAKSSGASLKDAVRQIGDNEPSQLDLVPLVLKLLKQQSQPDSSSAQSLGKGPVNDAR
jgi:hypothetical protein